MQYVRLKHNSGYDGIHGHVVEELLNEERQRVYAVQIPGQFGWLTFDPDQIELLPETSPAMRAKEWAEENYRIDIRCPYDLVEAVVFADSEGKWDDLRNNLDYIFGRYPNATSDTLMKDRIDHSFLFVIREGERSKVSGGIIFSGGEWTVNT